MNVVTAPRRTSAIGDATVEHALPTGSAHLLTKIGAGVLAIALTGGLLRAVFAVVQYPVTGDPVYSYCYRALLISAGVWSGLTLMWHPPGYPLFLGALTWLTGGGISPYAWGVGVSVISSLLLILVVDGLIRDRVRSPFTRLVVATFIAFYEGCLIISTAPLSEPPYLLLLFSALLWLDRGEMNFARALGAGALIGAATSIRFEGLGPLVGLLALVGSGYLGTDKQVRRKISPTALSGFALGAWVTAGWLFFATDYFLLASDYQKVSFSVPLATGFRGQLVRLAECAYFAMVTWLPQTLLLPYWLLVGVGLATTWGTTRLRRLNWLLLAALTPTLIIVTLTVMHKRTGAFLLPAAAIWLGFGVEHVAGLFKSRGSKFGFAAVLALAISANLCQVARVFLNLRLDPPNPNPVTRVQGEMLKAIEPTGTVWAFGGEPEVYAFADQPIEYPFFDRHRGYNSAYGRHIGDPRSFVGTLRARGFSYLTFSLGPPGAGNGDFKREKQPYGDFSTQPLRSDLLQLVENAQDFGLRLVALAKAGRAQQLDIYLFRILK